MTGNAAFPSPPVALADLQAATDDYVTKCAAAVKGGQVDTAAKNNARVILVEMLRHLAGYVQIHCANDLAVLLSSGFSDPGSEPRVHATFATARPGNQARQERTTLSRR